MGRNANGTTTGGTTSADADQIKDFVRGEDKIQLTDSQSFDELTFVESNGNTLIQDRVTSEFLATIEGVTDIDATDFKSETAEAGDAGSIQFSSANYSGSEAEARSASPNRVSITVSRSGGSSGAVTVNYSTAAGVQNPAEAATDYTEISNGVLSWADGETGDKTFEVLLPSDGDTNVVEDSETFSLLLDSPTNGAVLGDIQSAVFTINDGAVADTGSAPTLVGAELLVADAAGSSIGQVTSSTASSYSVTGAVSDTGATVENPITVDTSGNLTLTAAGATALDSVQYLDVTIATDLGAESTIRVYGNIENAVNDDIIGDVLDISDGTGQNVIQVGAGAYAEDVNLDKEVTLNGPSAGIAGVATRSTEANLTGEFKATASNATVDGFTFDTTGQVSIDTIVDALSIKNNIFSGQTKTAIKATVAATDLDISTNLFDENNATAIDLNKVAKTTISGNTFRNFDGGANVDAISVVDLATEAKITNNDIQAHTKAGRGIDIAATAAAPTGAITVSQNKIDSTGGAAISFDTTTALTVPSSITNNTITDASFTTEEGGIQLLAANTLVAAGALTIQGNDIDESDGGGVRVNGAVADPLGLVVTGNNLDTNFSSTDPTTAIGGLGVYFVADPGAADVNFSGNFWGVATPKLSQSGVTGGAGNGNLIIQAAPAGGDPTIVSPDSNVDFGNALLTAV